LKKNKRIYVTSDKYLSILWTERTVDAFINWLEEIRDFQSANGERLNSVYSHVGKNIRDYVGTSCVCIGLTNIADQRRFMTPPFQISRKLRRSLWFQTILTILTLYFFPNLSVNFVFNLKRFDLVVIAHCSLCHLAVLT
jgi:hypothetical protein